MDIDSWGEGIKYSICYNHAILSEISLWPGRLLSVWRQGLTSRVRRRLLGCIVTTYTFAPLTASLKALYEMVGDTHQSTVLCEAPTIVSPSLAQCVSALPIPIYSATAKKCRQCTRIHDDLLYDVTTCVVETWLNSRQVAAHQYVGHTKQEHPNGFITFSGPFVANSSMAFQRLKGLLPFEDYKSRIGCPWLGKLLEMLISIANCTRLAKFTTWVSIMDICDKF